MIDLHKFLVNPFDSEEVSIAELFRFGTDHLQRLTVSNPGGVFTTRISNSSSALSNVYKAHSDDETQVGFRAAAKLAKDEFRKTLPQSMEKISGALTVKYGSKSPQMLTCFPQGRTPFQRVADDGVQDLLAALVAALASLQPDMADALTLANNLVTGWKVVYDASESGSAAKSHTEISRRDARRALQLELFLNLLAIAQQFPRQPEMLDEYMQQSLLMNRVHPAEPTPTPAPAPTPA